jgi:hypothetical protein
MIAQGRQRRQRESQDFSGKIRSIMDLTANYNADTPTTSGRNRELDTMAGIEAVQRATSIHVDRGTQHHSSLTSEGITLASAKYSVLLDKSYEALKKLRSNVPTGETSEDGDTSDADPSSNADDTHNGSHARAQDIQEPEDPDVFATQRGLNVEQRAMFLAYVRHAGRNLLNPGEPTLIPAENFILTGEGGSGKTHTIQCIIDFFTIRGWSRYMRVAATTGAAAANLHRGASTVDTLLKLGFKKRSTDPVTNEFASSLADVLYLIVDEVSMMSCESLEVVCSRLKSKQGTFEHPSGKVSILFAGDPHQFQPIDGVSLSRRKPAEHRGPPTERDKSVYVGASIWVSITNVVVLQQNYRQSGSAALQEMLSRMRSGQLLPSDCATLDARILRNLPPLTSASIGSTQFIVQRNNLRSAMNDYLDRLDCSAATKVGVIVRSEDVLAATQQRATPEVQAWIDKYGKASEVKHMQSATFFYVGQEVRFTHNLAPELGIANGSLGKVVGIILDPQEPNNAPNVTGYVRPALLPAYILVKVETLTVRLNESLDIGVVPVKPMTASAKLRVKPGNSSGAHIVSYARTAFPLIPTRCITDYKSQGSGFSNTVVDLAYPSDGPRPDYALAVYVMLSRVRTLEGLRILRPFDHQKMQAPFPGHIREEWNRLVALSSIFVHRTVTTHI